MQALVSPSLRTTSGKGTADDRQDAIWSGPNASAVGARTQKAASRRVLWWYAMICSRPRLPRWLPAVALLSVALFATSAVAQGPGSFRITHVVEKSTQTQVTITGRVYNEARSDAIDVYVTAEALDAGGKVMASGVSYVGSVAAGSSTAFVVKVPSARTPASFRVLVTSHRFGFANQS